LVSYQVSTFAALFQPSSERSPSTAIAPVIFLMVTGSPCSDSCGSEKAAE